MKIKICGITNLTDALAAAEAGADMLGFNFYPQSPRYITPNNCAAIIWKLRKRETPAIYVGVFVNTGELAIRTTLETTGLDLAQLSGDEPVECLSDLGTLAFKAIRKIETGPLMENAELFARLRGNDPPAFLLDASVNGTYGGTGITADWDLASGLAARHSFLLAGGLTPENVTEAIRRVQPWGVDVASGVETSPGRKDEHKVRLFIQNARIAAKLIGPQPNFMEQP